MDYTSCAELYLFKDKIPVLGLDNVERRSSFNPFNKSQRIIYIYHVMAFIERIFTNNLDSDILTADCVSCYDEATQKF